MGLFILTNAILNLLGTIRRVSTMATALVPDVCDAHRDMDSVKRKISSLTVILEFLSHDVEEASGTNIPESLQMQVFGHRLES